MKIKSLGLYCVTAALVGCASNPPEPVQRTAAPEAAPAFDAPIIEAPAAAEESLAELEASLAVYEQQLARNEARPHRPT